MTLVRVSNVFPPTLVPAGGSAGVGGRESNDGVRGLAVVCDLLSNGCFDLVAGERGGGGRAAAWLGDGGSRTFVGNSMSLKGKI